MVDQMKLVPRQQPSAYSESEKYGVGYLQNEKLTSENLNQCPAGQ